MLGDGAVDGLRLVSEGTARAMRTNRLTDAQRQIPFMGIPFWAGQGFGLGVSVITDPEKQGWMGAGMEGAFGWPGAFGTWWQADPKADMILLYMVQNSLPLRPDAAASPRRRPAHGVPHRPADVPENRLRRAYRASVETSPSGREEFTGPRRL